MFTITVQEYLLKLLQPRSIISLLSLAVLFIILITISKKTALNTHTIAYGALAMASAFVLSYFRIMEFPNGGSVTVASMLPIFVFAYIAGPRAGLAVGLCYGLLQFIL
jgi:thiamine transporter